MTLKRISNNFNSDYPAYEVDTHAARKLQLHMLSEAGSFHISVRSNDTSTPGSEIHVPSDAAAEIAAVLLGMGDCYL